MIGMFGNSSGNLYNLGALFGYHWRITCFNLQVLIETSTFGENLPAFVALHHSIPALTKIVRNVSSCRSLNQCLYIMPGVRSYAFSCLAQARQEWMGGGIPTIKLALFFNHRINTANE